MMARRSNRQQGKKHRLGNRREDRVEGHAADRARDHRVVRVEDRQAGARDHRVVRVEDARRTEQGTT